jgi:hypothetical protein
VAIAYRSGVAAGNASGGNLTINKPSGVVNGDILVVGFYREAGTLTLPAGWTQVVETRDNGSDAIYLTVAWKRASSEGASYTFTLSTSTWRAGVILAFSGCATSGSPVDTYATDNTTLSVPRLASITTSVANTMRVGYFSDYNSGGLTAGTSGMTESSGNGAVESFYAAQASAGASGTISNFGGYVASGDWASVHLALKPDTGGSAQTITPTGIDSAEAVGGAA